MKDEQKRLYDHFINLSKTNNGIIGKNALRYANDILKSFPEFEEKIKEKKIKEKE